MKNLGRPSLLLASILLLGGTLAEAAAPVAEDDEYEATAGGTLSVDRPGVLENDTDADGDPLTASLVGPPSAGGNVELFADGSFEYTPANGFAGVETFTYVASDGLDDSNVALVRMIVVGSGPVTVYTDPDLYLGALRSLGLVAVHEPFEDESVWGGVRTTVVGGSHVAPSIVNLGITWTSNHPENDVTTSDGAAYTGLWGFYSSPHGNYTTGTGCDQPRVCGDGIVGTVQQPVFAVGGWVRTNTPFAGLDLLLDGVPVDLDGLVLGTQTQFVGAISSEPIRSFEYLETEGTMEDAKFIFFDDFILGFATPPPGVFLSLAGSCPGGGTVLVSGIEPGSQAALLASRRVGPTILPSARCAGAALGIENPRLRGLIPADATGSGSIPMNLPQAACGAFLQVLDMRTCEPGNLIRVHRQMAEGE